MVVWTCASLHQRQLSLVAGSLAEAFPLALLPCRLLLFPTHQPPPFHGARCGKMACLTCAIRSTEWLLSKLRPQHQLRAISLPGIYTSSGGGPLKKDGTPDMRYTVNKQRYGSGGSGTASKSSRAPGSRVPGIHYKADGTPDMRYKSSREYVAQTQGSQAVLQRKAPPGGIPLRRDGLPDMRFKASKEYVEREIAAGNSSLVPP